MTKREVYSSGERGSLFLIACGFLASCAPLKADERRDVDNPNDGGGGDVVETSLADGDSDARPDVSVGPDVDTRDSKEDSSTSDRREADADSDGNGSDAPIDQSVDEDGAAQDTGNPDGDGSPQDTCNDPCAESGAARCANATQIQICADLNGCLQWVNIGTCPGTSLCCAGSCVAADNANCYECGATCGGRTPACSPVLKKCVCTDEKCAVSGQTCNPITGACDIPLADYYVDAKAPAGGDGTVLRPFQTITTAVDAATNDAGVTKSIYVAPGTYDEALGERFPLRVRGLSIRGAGANKTIVDGSGEFDHAGEGGTFDAQYWGTFIAGHPLLPSTISDLSVKPGPSGLVTNHTGVFCDRGSASGVVTAPAGQTIIDRTSIGPGFHTAIVAATSTSPSATGCNLRLTGSTLTGGWVGVHAVGCGFGKGSAPVLLEVGGEDPSSGNLLSGMQIPDGGWGAIVWGCVNAGVFRHNVFNGNGTGVTIDQRGDASATDRLFSFSHNKFTHMPRGGIWIHGTASESPTLAEVLDNSFIDISANLIKATGYAASGLAADLSNLGKVRRNQFIGNDVGVWLEIGDTNWRPGDLGTVADPGNNVFRCNSSLSQSRGGDVVVGGSSPGAIGLAGNRWDHSPPTVQATPTYAEGSDIALTGTPSATVDISGAGLATVECPAPRTAGP